MLIFLLSNQLEQLDLTRWAFKKEIIWYSSVEEASVAISNTARSYQEIHNQRYHQVNWKGVTEPLD